MSDDADATDGDTLDEESTQTDDQFAREVENARDLLDADGVDALHVGVVRDGEIDSTFAQRAADPEREGLQALALLAAHVRLVANEAGVDPATVAGDAATLAGQVEEIPASTEAIPDEE